MLKSNGEYEKVETRQRVYSKPLRSTTRYSARGQSVDRD